jgi:hypothetical protein
MGPYIIISVRVCRSTLIRNLLRTLLHNNCFCALLVAVPYSYVNLTHPYFLQSGVHFATVELLRQISELIRIDSSNGKFLILLWWPETCCLIAAGDKNYIRAHINMQNKSGSRIQDTVNLELFYLPMDKFNSSQSGLLMNYVQVYLICILFIVRTTAYPYWTLIFVFPLGP